jgi:hypothetical protein
MLLAIGICEVMMMIEIDWIADDVLGRVDGCA